MESITTGFVSIFSRGLIQMEENWLSSFDRALITHERGPAVCAPGGLPVALPRGRPGGGRARGSREGGGEFGRHRAAVL